tara:strand:+ start:3341 stop:4258 length:918 start_codon:yes stop_codon:yes gene_type:complete
MDIMKPPHLTIARNNIFLSVWEETLRDTFFTKSCGSPLSFLFNLIDELYPENSVFSLWNENAEDFALKLSANNTLWENIVLNCLGTCCYDHTDEDEYFSSDIKAGDMFLIVHQNLPSDYIPNVTPHIYIGDGHFFNWNMGEQEPIENIKKSVMGAKLKWVLRYNFDRTDTKTPSGAEDILTWENFWGESYVSMNNLSYDKNHRDTSQRELVASIDINGTITTDISPVPTLSDFFKIFLLKDCLVCFKEFDSVENEYTKNGEFLKSYPSTAGEGYYRYNWTLEFDASKYTDMENHLNTNNLQYRVI